MADHQRIRIHPAPDGEAAVPPSPPSAPLIPPNTIKSDSKNHHNYPPPPVRSHPVSYSPPPTRTRPRRSKRGCCCRAFCCVFCLLLILIIAIAATIGILFLIFHPKIPKYSISTLQITQFAPGSDGSSLTATFAVNITARNPNKRIGVYYLGGSRLSAWYKNTLLCEGALPEFYQGHRNTTAVEVPLTGTVANATALAADLQEQQRKTGDIPLVLNGKVPIRVKLGKLKLMKMSFKVRCELSVDRLASNNQVRIGSSDCKIKLKKIF